MATHSTDDRPHGTAVLQGTEIADSPLSAAGIASFLDADWTGPNANVRRVDSLADAGTEDLAFCVHEDDSYVRATDAGVVVCPPEVGPVPDQSLVFAPEPKVAFARIAHEFFLRPLDRSRVHPSAVVDGAATVGEGCRVGPGATIAAPVTVGDDCYVGAGTALGGVGFGFVRRDSGPPLRQIHAGEVVVEDDVAIGPNCTVDRAVFDRTVVRRGAKLSAGVHLAHRVEVGERATVAFGCGFAGGATVGDDAMVHPHATVATDVTVGEGAEVGMNATVLDDVPPGTTVVGTPARPVDDT